MSAQIIIQQLRKNNIRIGRVRKHIISVFFSYDKPLSAQDIIDALAKNNISANKTTVYRELDFLKKQHLIKELQLQPNIRHFELADQHHHHHLICEKCKSIQSVENHDLENRMNTVERSVLSGKQFKITRHALEFYGVCGNCQ